MAATRTRRSGPPCRLCGAPIPRRAPGRGRPADHCCRECGVVTASISSVVVHIAALEDRATQDAWTRVRSEIWALGNLRAWNAKPGRVLPQEPRRAQIRVPGECWVCGCKVSRAPGARGPAPATCEECKPIARDLRTLRSRLRVVIHKISASNWRQLRSEFWGMANGRAWNRSENAKGSDDSDGDR